MSQGPSSTQRVIVVGVDGSDASRDALTWAAGQARLTGATLEAVTSWHIPAAAYGAMLMPVGTDFAADATKALAAAATAVLGEDPDIDLKQVVVQGPPALALLEAAEGAELLVVGSRGHGAFTGMLLGSVSEHLVAHAPCPVVVVRHQSDPDAAAT